MDKCVLRIKFFLCRGLVRAMVSVVEHNVRAGVESANAQIRGTPREGVFFRGIRTLHPCACPASACELALGGARHAAQGLPSRHSDVANSGSDQVLQHRQKSKTPHEGVIEGDSLGTSMCLSGQCLRTGARRRAACRTKSRLTPSGWLRRANRQSCRFVEPRGSHQVLHHSQKSKTPHEGALCFSGGEGGIRTPGTLTRTPDFESGTFNRSATSPKGLAAGRPAPTAAGRHHTS